VGLKGGSVDDGGKSEREKSGGEKGARNLRGERDNECEGKQSAENERCAVRSSSGPSEKETPREDSDGEFGQTHDGVEAENIFPKERRFAGVDFVEAVRVEVDVAERKQEAHEPRTREANRKLPLREFRASGQEQRENKIEKSFDREAPADGIPRQRGLRNPGLKKSNRKETSCEQVLLAPGEEGQVQLADSEKEKRRSHNQGKNIGWIDAREACPPEFFRLEQLAFVCVNEDEAGQNEEEIDTNVADAREILIPLGAAGKNPHDAHMKQDDLKRGKEAKTRQRMDSWPHSVRVLTP